MKNLIVIGTAIFTAKKVIDLASKKSISAKSISRNLINSNDIKGSEFKTGIVKRVNGKFTRVYG